MPWNFKKLQRFVIAFSSLIILILIISSPKQSLSAALMGLNTWLNVVMPSLLPFFIVSEIMIELGIVDLISVMLYPIMKPLFNCPGESSFIWIMGITSGYPMGAKLIASFYEGGSLTKAQGQRMLAFCNTSGPLFMIGAVGVGMLGSQKAGNIIAISHYSASIIIGLLFRFYARKEKDRRLDSKKDSISSAFNRILIGSPTKDQSFGMILGNSVKNSMKSQFLIGGFIILFSVIINLFIQSGSMSGLEHIPNSWAFDFPNPAESFKSIFAGIFEVTTGAQLIGKSILSMENKLIVLSFLIGWGGFSIHSQSISFLAKTNLSMSLYLVSKLLHGILSAIITYGLTHFVYLESVPVFSGSTQVPAITWSCTLKASMELLLSAFFALIALFLFGVLVKSIKRSE